MKKSLLTLSLFFCVASAFSQDDSKKAEVAKDAGNNEIKINLLGSIIGMPEITYERLFKDNTAIGLSALVGIDNDLDYKYGFIPHYRIYFGNKKAGGFFIEANAALMGVNSYSYVYYSNGNMSWYGSSATKTTANFGLGAAAGGKFLTKNGFIGEIFGGVGRFFGKNNELEAYPRVGISIGKRF
jgi:hypothetical protein